ncbi:MAG TPA: hypothetical protein VE591_11975 [Candidatus Acidoferrum sp.]|nr:hypothetical protein [Candidatus Acidoferrum sp.]
MKRFLGSALIEAALALPLAAPADTNTDALRPPEQRIHGTITSIDGTYGLVVRDERSGAERVTLHKGTVINPTGLTLEPGMPVTIVGHPSDRAFVADEIDAPRRYLDAQERATRAPRITFPSTSNVPNGTFQTNGPSAEGGG